MNPPTNMPNEHQHSIIQRVLDGSLKVESVEEFKDILEIYPDDPLLQRKYADLLLDKSRLDEAIEAFDRASRLFVEEGMNLQAIVAKILEWSIRKPTHAQGQQFQKLLSQKGAQYTPLQRLWANMSYGELITIMLRLVRVRLSKGKKIACIDEPANDIYFVVSGTLAETVSPDCQMEAARAGVDTEPMMLGPNDIFGNIFPLDQPTRSYTDVVAVNDVELVKISKPVLHSTCQKYPNVSNLLLEMHNPENVNKCDRSWQSVRRSIRFGIPTKVELTPSPSGKAKPLTGIAVDLSLGGVCVDLGPTESITNEHFAKGKFVQIELDLLNEVATVDIGGKIVWYRKRTIKNVESLFIGIRFDSMNATDRGLVSEYCSGSIGEQNLLWGLWDTLVKSDDDVGNNGERPKNDQQS